jgi:hypothetical protein
LACRGNAVQILEHTLANYSGQGDFVFSGTIVERE